MEKTTLQQQLKEVRCQRREIEVAVGATLRAAERAEQGKIDAWVSKDTLVHSNVWKENLAEHLAHGRAGCAVTKRDDFLAYNDEGFKPFQQAFREDISRYKGNLQ